MRLDLKMEFVFSFEDAQEAKNEMKDILFLQTSISFQGVHRNNILWFKTHRDVCHSYDMNKRYFSVLLEASTNTWNYTFLYNVIKTFGNLDPLHNPRVVAIESINTKENG